jgi:malonate-semialdehyde dehydrogenase (acetylating)/methylmalonate-semialdehyde dehydrogenase
MPVTKSSLTPCPYFIGGEWIQPKVAGTPVFNPSTGDTIAECPIGTAADVNAAVEAAAAAFPAWMETPPVERVRILGRFKMLMEDNFEDIVCSNTREHGKTLVESRGDVKRGMEVIEFALGVPSLMMGEVLENIARLITEEHGKTLPDALGSVQRGIEVVEFACGNCTWI